MTFPFNMLGERTKYCAFAVQRPIWKLGLFCTIGLLPLPVIARNAATKQSRLTELALFDTVVRSSLPPAACSLQIGFVSHNVIASEARQSPPVAPVETPPIE